MSQVKRQQKPRKFSDDWLKLDSCKMWLMKKNLPGTKEAGAWCKFCCEFFENKRCTLQAHSSTEKHKGKIVQYERMCAERETLQEFTAPVPDRVTILEIRSVFLLSEKQLPNCLADDILDVFKSVSPCKIIANACLGRTRAGNMIRIGILNNEITEVKNIWYFYIR